MPDSIVFGCEARNIEAVSDAIERLTSSSREGHESSYVGVYDLFRLPESVIVKYNYVEEEREWDYPEFKHFPVLIVVESTERLKFFESLISQLGMSITVIEQSQS